MTKHLEKQSSVESERNKLFEDIYQEAIAKDGGFIDYQNPYPKHEFLDFLVREKGVVIHGSNWDAEELEPRQANCRSKKFGNLEAVYATQNAILPIFYAIKDKEKFRGVAQSGFGEEMNDSGEVSKGYKFAVDSHMLQLKPWSRGIIYILPRDSFEQGTDDDGNPIDEFVSRTPVKPLAKLSVDPSDFPYLDKIQPLQE